MNMDRLISCFRESDQQKLEFATNFTNEMQLIDFNGSRIQIMEMDVKTF